MSRKRPPRYDRTKPLSDPGRRQFALRVLRARDRELLAAMQADQTRAAVARAAIERISKALQAEGDDA